MNFNINKLFSALYKDIQLDRGKSKVIELSEETLKNIFNFMTEQILSVVTFNTKQEITKIFHLKVKVNNSLKIDYKLI